jgi:hypothetical protein
MAGRRGKCKQCGALIQIPNSSEKKSDIQQDMAEETLPWNSRPKRDISRIEKRCGDAPIYLMGGSRRFFSGPGSLDYRGDLLAVKGPIGPDFVEMIQVFVPVMIIGNLLFWVISLPTLAAVFDAFCMIIFVAHPLLSRDMRSIRVKRDSIAEVICDGPIFTIRFVSAPVPGLKAIRMFIAPHSRTKFFCEFDTKFPQVLPEEFRAAAERFRQVAGEET